MIDPARIYELVQGLPPWLAVVIMAALPVAELRLSLPYALIGFGMEPLPAYLLSVLGNMVPIVPILLLFGPAHRLLDDVWPFRSIFRWLIGRVERHRPTFERWGPLALVSFVAIPLPVTGAWTGSVAAFVFHVRRRDAFLLLLAGVMIAGLIVMALTYSGVMTVRVVTGPSLP